MPSKKNNKRAEVLINTMGCARWLVGQFEEIGFGTIAKIFQRAVDDADAWIQTKAVDGELPNEAATPIKQRELVMLHNMIVKYSSLSPSVREQFLMDLNQDMKKNKQGRQQRK